MLRPPSSLKVAALSLLISLPLQGADHLKILTVGNSFADNATAFLPDAAKSAGKEVTLFKANLAAHTLKQHASYLEAYRTAPESPEAKKYLLSPKEKTRISLPEALKLEAWDGVTIQQASFASSRPETFEPYATELIAGIREFAPNAKIWVHETWPYHERHANAREPSEMYEKLHFAYKELAARHGLQVIPVGTAFNAALKDGAWNNRPDPNFDYENPPFKALPNEKRGLYAGWNWGRNHQRQEWELRFDSAHANAAGKYLGATVFLYFLFPDVKDHSFVPPELTSEEAAELRGIARSVVPYKEH